MRTNIKITSVVMMVILSVIIGYLSLTLDDEVNNTASFVELKGNIHLPKDEYLKFAGLSEIGKDTKVDIRIIRDRLSKHPYVEAADVIIEGSTLMIELREKRFSAILSTNDAQFLISENSVAVPFLPFTQQINYPLISNPKMDTTITPLSFVNGYGDVVCALKILSSVELVNSDMYDQLSEINLRDGRDILVHFSNVNYPIIIGRGSEIRKILTFNLLWNNLSGSGVNDVINYVDLRYANHVFLGFSENSGVGRGGRI